MWVVTRRTAFVLHREVFIGERALLIRVALNTHGVGTGRQAGLFRLETTVRVVAVAATHCALENLVVKRLIKLVFRFAVTLHAELGLSFYQQFLSSEAGFLCISWRHKRIGVRLIRSGGRRVRCVTVSTANVLSPVFAATEVVVFFTSSVAG